jgi:hypothetical protein
MRIAADDGRSLLGREVAAVHLKALGGKLGLDISLDMHPGELAETVLRRARRCRLPPPRRSLSSARW